MIGLIGKKIGMTEHFNEEGNVVPLTLIKLEKNIVVNIRTLEKDGYNAVVLASIDLKDKKVNKPLKGQFKDKLTPKAVLKEFRIDDPKQFEVGAEIGLEALGNPEYIDVIGMSKGKGFQGVMKRHGFAGGPGSHGSKFHRHNGSTGQNTWPSHVFKGIKRAGRMGFDKVTSQNLKVFGYDAEESVLLVRGAVPGVNDGVVYINSAKKKLNIVKKKK
jgi:large subunit ribosomal protein L3